MRTIALHNGFNDILDDENVGDTVFFHELIDIQIVRQGVPASVLIADVGNVKACRDKL